MNKLAYISKCGLYRYDLIRQWGPESLLVWCMLNPSTADQLEDDPTIRRCIGFSKRWGYGGIRVVNLFALRATDPKKLLSTYDPVGPDNERMLRSMSSPVVVGWGSRISGIPFAYSLIKILQDRAQRWVGQWWCLGFTKRGHPRHPLMVPYSKEKENWPKIAPSK